MTGTDGDRDVAGRGSRRLLPWAVLAVAAVGVEVVADDFEPYVLFVALGYLVDRHTWHGPVRRRR